VETVLSYAFLIWTNPRTAGTTLSAALKAISEHPPAEDECFWYQPNARQFSYIYEDWCIDGDPAALYEVLSRHVLIKHIPEPFDDNFNADLARAAEYNGYRHIHLVRCDTFARLVSRGVAEQLDEWHIDVRSAKVTKLKPLDVPHLISDLRLDAARWDAVRHHLSSVLTIRTEDLVSQNCERRHACFRRLLRFLELPPDGLAALDQAFARGGHNTQSVWQLVPNLGELRGALARECVI
jgi:hypothetical protein